MEGLTLLRRAQDAGLIVAVEGDTLVIRGPKRAEPVARLLIQHKPEVMAALIRVESPLEAAECGIDPAWWRRHYLVRAINWGLSGARSETQARGIAWGELLNEWHTRYGTHTAQWLCSGCGSPIGGLAAMTVADGSRVHLGDDFSCLLRFGEHWRNEATAGLRVFGLRPPAGFEP